MPLQNRVNPFGELVATPERGGWTGNRGVLIDGQRRLRRTWRLKRWIICRLSYKEMWRPVWTPGRWTELFFLDEATALAAGHRPCMYCRRADALRFRRCWERAHGPVRSLVELDEVLHEARGRRWVSELGDLPEGTMVLVEGACWLWWEGLLWPWSFGGYGAPVAGSGPVTVLTPEPVVGALRGGYRCEVAASGIGGAVGRGGQG